MQNAQHNTHTGGFTLTEVLVVIGLIVLLILLAVPAFGLISGSRSVDAGENLVAAMLGRARAEAVRHRRPTSVAFFKDPAVDRYVMAIAVEASQTGDTLPEPAGLDNYKSWTQFQEDGVTPVFYQPGHTVIAMVLVTDPLPPSGAPITKAVTRKFVCTDAHTADPTLRPRIPAVAPWSVLEEQAVDAQAGFEYQYLPKGVGVQLVHDAKGPGDRYVSRGVIKFDERGQLVHEPFEWEATGTLADQGNRQGSPPTPTALVGVGGAEIYTQLGVVVYDDERFKNNGDLGDVVYGDAAGNEAAEEQWLDDNAVVLMINRYNGTLVRSR